MKKPLYLFVLFLLPVLAPAEVAVMVKQHSTHKSFEERPYGKDDISYGAFYELMDGAAGWRIGAMYGSDLSGAFEADSVITPEITLLIQDGIWESGISILRDYVDSETASGWEKLYYQLQLGINLPIGKHASVGGTVFYPFDKFSNITDFSFDDLDYGLVVRIRF